MQTNNIKVIKYGPFLDDDFTSSEDNLDIQTESEVEKKADQTINWEGIQRAKDPECKVNIGSSALKPFCFLYEKLQSIFKNKSAANSFKNETTASSKLTK